MGSYGIGAFDETSVKVLLGVPGEAKVIAMMPVGYPVSAGLMGFTENRRNPGDAIVAWNRWGR